MTFIVGLRAADLLLYVSRPSTWHSHSCTMTSGCA